MEQNQSALDRRLAAIADDIARSYLAEQGPDESTWRCLRQVYAELDDAHFQQVWRRALHIYLADPPGLQARAVGSRPEPVDPAPAPAAVPADATAARPDHGELDELTAAGTATLHGRASPRQRRAD